MEEKDYSEFIYDNYYSEDKPLKITLKNGTVLVGNLMGFYHGDADSNEPFIIRWHYMGSNEDKLRPIGSGEQGAFLEQEDIESVEFS